MAEKKYVVPEGILDAAQQALRDKFAFVECDDSTLRRYLKTSLEAALLRLAENPVVPTQAQAVDLGLSVHGETTSERYQLLVAEWQRRMFLAPEPEFDATLGGALLGRTWTQEQADALILNIQTATHGYKREAPELETLDSLRDGVLNKAHQTNKDFFDSRHNAPEPEVPEAIKDLLSDGTNDEPGNSDNRVLEAYRRGLGLV